MGLNFFRGTGSHWLSQILFKWKHCVKFEVTGFYTLEVMARTKICGKNFEREITQ